MWSEVRPDILPAAGAHNPDYVKLVPGVLSECPTFELPGEAVEDKALPGVPHFARALRER